MALPAVSLVLLLSLASFVVAQETPNENTKSGNVTYWVTLPSRMRRGSSVPVSAQLLAAGATSTVYVTLRNSTDGQVFSSAEPRVVTGGSPPTVINLMIPRDLKIPDENDFYYWSYSRQFEIRVVATGDVAFNRSGDMTLEDKSFSIFVQTDKAMYKPGDTIRWRILAMKPDLTVLNELVDVFIKDPLNNVIRQWKGVSGGDSGVVELSMPTSDRLVLGDWTIEAKVLGVKQTKTFTVAEYVLPKYEAKVDVPANVLSTDPVKGTASAKYTFGKPLVGAKVEVTAKFKYYWSETPQPNISLSGILDSKGEFPFIFSNEELINLLNETYPYRATWSTSVSRLRQRADHRQHHGSRHRSADGSGR
ncbi:CD109 antigen-like [Pomacea canaliculata]|uniref:CD109 antigen-like n=1 Tax=Pomacea canaliculata TaxID=400727 RepID=UPI000D73BFCF|nr:CD109 antigen-like [Pomacea canaliculata]XP_025086975.1 CD109 antigen-like [Pomacea canaliculata]